MVIIAVVEVEEEATASLNTVESIRDLSMEATESAEALIAALEAPDVDSEEASSVAQQAKTLATDIKQVRKAQSIFYLQVRSVLAVIVWRPVMQPVIVRTALCVAQENQRRQE